MSFRKETQPIRASLARASNVHVIDKYRVMLSCRPARLHNEIGISQPYPQHLFAQTKIVICPDSNRIRLAAIHLSAAGPLLFSHNNLNYGTIPTVYTPSNFSQLSTTKHLVEHRGGCRIAVQRACARDRICIGFTQPRLKTGTATGTDPDKRLAPEADDDNQTAKLRRGLVGCD